MSRKRILMGLAVFSALCLGPFLAWAQQQVEVTGQDSSGNVRILRTDTSGRIVTTGDTSASAATGDVEAAHGACTSTALTLTGTAANVPTSARSDRRSLTICASTAGEVISCEFDGSAAVLATGVELGNLDCWRENLVGAVDASCISDGTSVDVRVMECP